MNNKAKAEKIAKRISGKSKGTYKCQICNRETKSSVDAITHLLDHGSSALNAINALIKDQKVGRVSTEERASDGKMASAKKNKKMAVAQDA
jgi:hypothetical protein